MTSVYTTCGNVTADFLLFNQFNFFQKFVLPMNKEQEKV